MVRTMRSKWLSLALSLAMIVCLIPLTAVKTHAETLAAPLDFTEMESNSGEGWSWDKDKATLTLNNFSMDLTGSEELYEDALRLPDGAFVVLQGDSNIIRLSGRVSEEQPHSGIYGFGNLTIYGTGRLTVDAEDGAVGILAEKDLTLGTLDPVAITATGAECAIGAGEKIYIQHADIEAEAMDAYAAILAGNVSQAMETPAILVYDSDLSIAAGGDGSTGLGAVYGNIQFGDSSYNQTPLADSPETTGIYAANGSVILDKTEVEIYQDGSDSWAIAADHRDLNFELDKSDIDIINSTLDLTAEDCALYANYGGIQIAESVVDASADGYCADIGIGGLTISGGSDVSLISNGHYMAAGLRNCGPLNVIQSNLNCEGNGDRGVGALVNWGAHASFTGKNTRIHFAGEDYAFQMCGSQSEYQEDPLYLGNGLYPINGENFLSVDDSEGDTLWSFTYDEELELDEDGVLANASTEVYIGAPVMMTVDVKGTREIFDYDGTTHVAKGVTFESPDHPELFELYKVIDHSLANKGISQSMPGTYYMNLESDDFMYDDPYMEVIFHIAEDGYLKINEPQGGPAVKGQPASMHVNYPNAADFRVEAENPDEVVSYQWIASDGVRWFTLDGTSAKTNHLIIPSTMQDDPDMSYRCILTDAEGNATFSSKATLSIENSHEDKTILYVGNYALEPGKSLDLAKTEGILGSGVITFDESGKEITLDNVQYDNSTMLYDSTLSPALGLTLYRQNNKTFCYNIILKGENKITNNFYQEESNSGGMDFQIMMLGDEDTRPLVWMQGDGSLTLVGGSDALFVDGYLLIDVPITIRPNSNVLGGKLFLDGIHADYIGVGEGVKLDFDVNGGGLVAESNMILPATELEKGSEVKIHTSAPHVANDYTQKAAIFTGELYMDNATLTIEADAAPEQFIPYGLGVADLGGIFLNTGDMEAYDSTIKINMTAAPSEEDYIGSYLGINGYYSNIKLDNTYLSITINSDQVHEAYGMYTNGSIDITNNSKVTTRIAALENVYGIAPEGALNVTDSDITNNSEALSEDGACYGVLCDKFNIKDTKKGYCFTSTAKNGIGLAANTGKTGTTEKTYDPSYKAKKYQFEGGAAFTVPVSPAISTASIWDGDEKFIYVEAVYDQNDTSKPASTVVIDGLDPITDATVTLAYTETVYNGKAKEPAVTVKLDSTTLRKGTDYTVEYSNNTKVGTATVTVRGTGNYAGTLAKTFTIVPKTTAISKVTGSKKALTVKWKKQTKETTGYQLQYSTSKSFQSGNKQVTVKSNKTTSKKISKLKSKKTYYVRIRTYKKVNGKTYYSAWSKAKSAKTK